jgi:hypothetical protein
MRDELGKRWRHVLPWVISAALLAYVFGWMTDWQQLLATMRRANVPVFVALAAVDRLGFFVVWTWLQAEALSRFLVRVPFRSVVAIRGGSELLRAISNPLSDAAFFLGLVHLAGGRFSAVVAAVMVPAVLHFLVMLIQMTVALPFLEGGVAGSRDVVIALSVMWPLVLAVAVGVRISSRRPVPVPGAARLRAWLEGFEFRDLQLFFWSFVGLAVFDVVIQGLASQAYGVDISWGALAARIPLVYLSFIIPTLGNFGTRELAWAALFSEFGSRDALIGYAFAVNTVFLVINLLLGILFLSAALELVTSVRRARREGQPLLKPPLHDPTDL